MSFSRRVVRELKQCVRRLPSSLTDVATLVVIGLVILVFGYLAIAAFVLLMGHPVNTPGW